MRNGSSRFRPNKTVAHPDLRLLNTGATWSLSLVPVFLSLGLLVGCGQQRNDGGRPPGPPPGFPNLTKALRDSPGCLGVEAARLASGKNVIFAWFENKNAAVTWYNSQVHRGVMKKYFPESGVGRPMSDIPDDSGPILTIASITFAKEPEVAGTTLPISQIAIEHYAPLSGGIAYGGRFSPGGMKLAGAKSNANVADSANADAK